MSVFFAYVDESGDSGYHNSPTSWFALSVVLVREVDWLSALDRLVDMRRYLRDQYGLSPRAELKANYIVHNKGPFRSLGLKLETRLEIFRLVLRAQRQLGFFTTWAIVIDKDRIKRRNRDPRDFAWQYMIERMDNLSHRQGELLKLFPDAGHGYFIRRKVRMMRRFHRVPSAFGTEQLQASTQRIVEDPSDRDSKESYFIQLADLNCYAAVRHVLPDKRVGKEFWDELGDARLEDVNKLRGGPTGIKLFPGT
ncbi:DUF3800 domain-containing protein [Gaopeijia maritima]|uniref:DUF3800 domain-containing protein n=1 Tax=Gaopeijia maritima TaxID=3119007 RepID=UPI0032481424